MDASTLAFVSYGANLAAQGADSFLTNAGLAKGFIEGNFITRPLIKKFGQNFVNIFKIGVIPFLGLAVFYKNPEYASAFGFIMAGVTAPVIVWNFIQLKRKKVAIF